jgi:hypothetical protein
MNDELELLLAHEKRTRRSKAMKNLSIGSQGKGHYWTYKNDELELLLAHEKRDRER